MNWLRNMLNSSHITRTLIVVGIPLALAIFLIVGVGGVEAEQGWPLNEQAEPVSGGNWMGTGQMDVPPEGLSADWYNMTDQDVDWIIESGDDVLRSFSAFDFSRDLIIKDGGILRLDSVTFFVNSTDLEHQVIIRNGGALHITNSTLSVREIIVEEGGELSILGGNGTTHIAALSSDAPGITISENSEFLMRDSTMSGQSILIRVEDENAVIETNTFSTSGGGKGCIHLTASAAIIGNLFLEGASTGSYAIIAEEGVSSDISGNTFSKFRHGDQSTSGGAILSRGPLEIYDNLFEKMVMDTAADPYIIQFVGAEPALHDGDPVWEVNRFTGKTPGALDERVNILKQSWVVDVGVLSSLNGEPYQDALVEVKDRSDFPVTSGSTDPLGHVIFELPQFVVTASDDGETGDSDKDPTDLDPYDLIATLAGRSSSIEDRSISSNLELVITLSLIHHDVSISDMTLPDSITAGESLLIVCHLEDLGIARGDPALELRLNLESADGVWSFELGNKEVIMEDREVAVSLEASIPDEVPDTLFIVRAVATLDGDQNSTNDELSSDQFSINRRPIIIIQSPAEGAEVQDTILITGEVADDGTISLVRIGIDGTWYDVGGGEMWYYSLDTRAHPNGPLQISVRAQDDLGIGSDISLVNITLINGPAITITSPDDGSELDGRHEVTLVGSTLKHTADIMNVTISIDDSEEFPAIPVSTWNQWTFDLRKGDVDLLNPLSDGEHTIRATVTDADGLSGVVVHDYLVHSTDPSTDPVSTFTDPPSTVSSSTWITGTATDDYRVTHIEYRINDNHIHDNGWFPATEMNGIGTPEVAWRILIAPNQLEIGNNILEVRTHDHDGNTTATIQFIHEAPTSDLTVTDVLVQDALGNTLTASGLKVGEKITFIVYVGVTSEEILPQVAIRVIVAGQDVGIRTEENVSGDFDLPISIIVSSTNSISPGDTVTVIVDPANIIDESNEDNNEFSDILPVGGGDPGGEKTLPEQLMEPVGPLPLIAYVGIIVLVAILGVSMKSGKRS